VAADPLGDRPDRDPGQVGRLEMPPGSRLAGFSVTAAQLSALAAATATGASATVEVVVDQDARSMPVVTGLLPGSEDEMLLSAHLCHPRPGANDNASGVAALLGTARVLARHGQAETAAPGGPGVRFLWGPEFTGVAAYLHDMVLTGRVPPPVLAVNVDMAGQDVRRCGGPLVIERGPDDVPSFLPALAGRCADLLPPAARSYSGAVACDPWTWRATPFAGGSDHGLLSDEPTRCQAISLGHWPDRANHSSADTPDLVDPVELRRTAAIACATVAAVRGRADRALAGDIAEATLSWAACHVLSTLPGARPPATGDGLDPRAEASAHRMLRHRGIVARGAVKALSAAAAEAGWLRSANTWLDSIIGTAARRLPRGAAAARTAGPALERRWAGPVNLRALAEAARPPDRDWLADQLIADRGGNYARAVALMHAVNGKRDRREVTWWAALSSELPMRDAFADRFLDLLAAAGWTSCGDRR
jgi:Peptidase family M28